LGEHRDSSARGDVFTQRHHGDHARGAVDAAKDTDGRKQRLALLELDLLCVIPPVELGLSAGSFGSVVGFGRLSGDAT